MLPVFLTAASVLKTHKGFVERHSCTTKEKHLIPLFNSIDVTTRALDPFKDRKNIVIAKNIELSFSLQLMFICRNTKQVLRRGSAAIECGRSIEQVLGPLVTSQRAGYDWKRVLHLVKSRKDSRF